jgi:hypothetical protein
LQKTGQRTPSCSPQKHVTVASFSTPTPEENCRSFQNNETGREIYEKLKNNQQIAGLSPVHDIEMISFSARVFAITNSGILNGRKPEEN